MAPKRKLLGIDTDVWALIDEDGRVRGGDWKPHIYWTRKAAKEQQKKFPDCTVQPVRIVVSKVNGKR